MRVVGRCDGARTMQRGAARVPLHFRIPAQVTNCSRVSCQPTHLLRITGAINGNSQHVCCWILTNSAACLLHDFHLSSQELFRGPGGLQSRRC
jgi:hypothetical protein